MSQYKTGTVSVTNGSQVATGTGTLWLSNVSPGDGFTVAGTGVPYTVGSVDSDTQITLNANYAGATQSGAVYAIWRDFTTENNIPELVSGDIEAPTIFTRAMRLIDGSLAAIQGDYYRPDNILGTVSQSGGIPTGAIIERGSNANGEYVKFADGTLICLMAKTVTADINIATGTIYRSFTSAFSGNYPHAFINSNVVQSGQIMSSGSTDSNGYAVIFGVDDTDSTVSSYRSCLLSPASLSGATVRGRLIAIGRWF